MEQEYQNILVGIDGSEQALLAFKKAVEVGSKKSRYCIRSECDRSTIL